MPKKQKSDARNIQPGMNVEATKGDLGELAPVMVAMILLIGNNRQIMRNQRLGLLTNIGLAVSLLILLAGAALLFYGLAMGQGSS